MNAKKLNDSQLELNANATVFKRAVLCTRAICWVWITAAKYMVPLTLSYDKLKQTGNSRVNNYLTNIPSWSERIHKQPISLCSLVFLPCWLYSPSPGVIFRKALKNRCCAGLVRELETFLPPSQTFEERVSGTAVCCTQGLDITTVIPVKYYAIWLQHIPPLCFEKLS